MICNFFYVCILNFSTCYKVCSIHGIEVVLTTRSLYFKYRIAVTVIDCFIKFSAVGFVVCQCPMCRGSVDNITSSRVATD